MTMRFDGSAYHGWQVQKNAVTVQETLQDAIEKALGRRENVTGCSRTDAGVHANMYCCNFRTESKKGCETVVRALNAWLPRDIGVYDCREAPEDFHARYSCVSKEYRYVIWNSPYKNPFYQNRALHLKAPLLDADMLNEEAARFVGTFDYKAFASTGHSVVDTVRTVTACRVERLGDEVIFTVRADGFLYNMVRIMAGTLLDAARGGIAGGEIRDIILSGDRGRAGATAQACGLYLNRVNYEL